MTLELYFLRHGQTDHSRENMFCGCGSNPTLTDDGRLMAESFAKFYEHFNWTGIYCSTLTRAIETTKPLNKRFEITDGLKEIDFGAWEGQTVAEVKQKFPSEYENWNKNPNLFAPAGGERAQDVLVRSMAVIDNLKKSHDNGKFLFVSHKATIRILICSFLGIDLADYRIKLSCPVASLSKIELSGDRSQLMFLADRDHLSEELRSLPGT